MVGFSKARSAKELPRLSCIICTAIFPALQMRAITYSHDIAESEYGALAAQSAFSSFADVTYTNNFGQSTGGGVMISDNWLLTAAHVTWGSQQSGDVSIKFGGQQFTPSHVIYHPEWTAAPQVGLSQGSDLALIRLSGAPNHFSSIINTPVSAGTVGVPVGSGLTGTGFSGATDTTLQPLAAMNIIDRVVSTETSGTFLVTDFDSGSSFFNSLNQPTVPTIHYDDGFPGLQNAVIPNSSSLSAEGFSELPTVLDLFGTGPDLFLEGTTAIGDSGGPIYLLNEVSGEWEVAGLTSWGTNPLLEDGPDRQSSTYGDLAFYTSLYEHRDWINSIVPEPQSYTLILGALSAIWLGMRRRIKD